MKRVLFLVASLIVAGFALAANFSKDVMAKVTSNDEITVSEQIQPLVLEQTATMPMNVNRHYSHSSHGSHASHVSHYSSRF